MHQGASCQGSLSHIWKRTLLKQKGPGDCNVSSGITACWGASSRLQLRSFYILSSIRGGLGVLGQKVSSSSEPAGGQGLQRLLVLSSFRKVTEHPATTQVSIGLTLLPGREAFVVTYRWPGFMKMFAHNFLRVRGFLSLPCVCMLSHSVLSNSLQPFGLHPTRLLHPWNFPGKNTGMGCYFLLQESPWPRDWTLVSCVSCIAGRFCTHWAIRGVLTLPQREKIRLKTRNLNSNLVQSIISHMTSENLLPLWSAFVCFEGVGVFLFSELYC